MPVISYKKIVLMLPFVWFVFSGICNGGLEEEVSHLFSYVENSGCIFNRNGKKYSAPEAREHMERKYDHVRKRIQTTEQFIQYVATRSSMSGRLYTVNCGPKTLNSSEWLRIELDTYRKLKNIGQ